MSNRFDPDQALHLFGAERGPNSLQRLLQMTLGGKELIEQMSFCKLNFEDPDKTPRRKVF